MKYCVPELVLGALSPPQTQLVEKFGGLPWGLPVGKWPLCRECGNPQTHLATFTHSAERLDLGAEGRIVMVFRCGHSPNETNCDTTIANGGANAVVFLDAHELGTGLTEPPVLGTPKQIEMRVTAWVEEHDLVTPELEPSFLSGDSYWQYDEATEAVSASITDGAKLGSVPAWVQGGEDVDLAFRFAAQLGCSYHFPDPIPTADVVGVTISRWDNSKGRFGKYEVDKPSEPAPNVRGEIYISDITLARYGSGFDVDAADFGDGGSGYLFVQPDPVTPRGIFLWQCG